MRYALVLGGARSLWEDLDTARKLVPLEECTVLAVNQAGIYYDGHLDHFCTLHPEQFVPKIERQREGNRDFLVWAHKRRPGVTNVTLDWGGSSGLFAVKVALELGFGRVVVCGCPLDPQPHFDRPGAWEDYRSYQGAWRRHLSQLQGNVRSMSGWTSALLGLPDELWLLGTESATTQET